MNSQCLLYLILEMRSYAFWVVQAVGSGFVIVLVIHVFRKPTRMSMTKVKNCCHLSSQKPHEEVYDPKTYFAIILTECVKRIWKQSNAVEDGDHTI